MIPLPKEFIERVKNWLPDEADQFLAAIGSQPQTSIRLNPRKPGAIFPDSNKVPWCTDGSYLPERPSFITDPLFHAGAYYVQESSSMFLQQVMKQLKKLSVDPLKVLDLCAAPGGKSTLMLDVLDENDLLVSNEIIRSRVQVLDENLGKWGTSNTVLTQNDPKDFSGLRDYFDIILVDAPCSGEGLFRKNMKAIEEWSEANVALCASRQQRILSAVLPSLKPGGFLIYSTCTFNEKENEENVQWMMQDFGMRSIPIDIESAWNITVTGSPQFSTYRFHPHKVMGEGLFMACLQKPAGEIGTVKLAGKKTTLEPATKKEVAVLEQWLRTHENFRFVRMHHQYFAVQNTFQDDLSLLSGQLNLLSAGIRMGELMREQLIPDHALSKSIHLSPDAKRIEVSKDDALHFLKKDTMDLKGNPVGWAVITFKGLGLGWVKILPNRMNNYLPTNKRILKDILYDSN